jgi:hypothetical protein
MQILFFAFGAQNFVKRDGHVWSGKDAGRRDGSARRPPQTGISYAMYLKARRTSEEATGWFQDTWRSLAALARAALSGPSRLGDSLETVRLQGRIPFDAGGEFRPMLMVTGEDS